MVPIVRISGLWMAMKVTLPVVGAMIPLILRSLVMPVILESPAFSLILSIQPIVAVSVRLRLMPIRAIGDIDGEMLVPGLVCGTAVLWAAIIIIPILMLSVSTTIVMIYGALAWRGMIGVWGRSCLRRLVIMFTVSRNWWGVAVRRWCRLLKGWGWRKRLMRSGILMDGRRWWPWRPRGR